MIDKTDFDFEAVFEVDDYLYFYSESLTDERSEAEVAALEQLLELDHPMTILDLACGFGRHANRLAAKGHTVTGIDLMPGFIELARQDALRRAVQVDYCQGDMRQIDFHQAFDRVCLLFTAFGYFDDDENLLVLKKVTQALKLDGLFIFDTHNRDVFLKDFRPAFVTEKGTDLMIDRISFDTSTGRLYNRRIVIRNGLRKDKPFTIRLYNPSEVRAILAQAGLEVYKLYGSWDGQPLSTESRRMIVVARKTVASDQ